MTGYWLSQFLVLTAYLLLGFGLRKEKKVELLYYSTAYQFLMLMQYLLLNGYLGVISSVMGIVRNVSFINNEYKQKENSKSLLVLFSMATIILTSIFFTKPVDIFPCILTILGIYIYWCSNMKIIRLGNAGISLCYIFYAISLNSWISTICEVYLIINTIIGYVKHENKAKLIE